MMIRRGLEDSIPRAGRILRPTVTLLRGSLSSDGLRAQGGFGPRLLNERADGVCDMKKRKRKKPSFTATVPCDDRLSVGSLTAGRRRRRAGRRSPA